MLNTNRKGRATTLSKTLLTAGLLGGAALSTLGAGSAQAATGWVTYPPTGSPIGYSCSFGLTAGAGICDFGGTDPTLPVPPPNGDKILTLLGQTGILPGDDISFTKQPSSWELNLNFMVDRSAGASGNLDYKIDIIGSPNVFNVAALSTMLSPVSPLPVGPFRVTKKVYTDSLFNDLILTLTNNEVPSPAGTLVANSNISSSNLSTIYVRDEWAIPTDSNTIIDAIQNNYTQTQVPAPLPLLGVGAVLGSIRKLRKFSSQLKTLSLG